MSVFGTKRREGKEGGRRREEEVEEEEGRQWTVTLVPLRQQSRAVLV